jgi:streptogramin lyase
MRRRRSIASLAAGVLAATFVVAATAGLERTQAGPTYKIAGKWGGTGDRPGKFSGARGLAVDKAGNVYVADTDNHRVQMFSATGAFRKQWNLGEGLTVPDIAVGPGGEVWATTQVNATIVKLGGGEEITTPKSAEGVAVDADGNVYVSTVGDDLNAVVRYDKAASFAEAKRFGGMQEPGDDEVSPDGTVYVGDKRGSPPSVKRFDASGKLLKTIKLQMAATAGAGAQFGIGVDPDCNLWATNPEKRNVIKYSPSGKVLATATTGDMVGLDVAVGPKGDVYLFDQNGPYSVVRFTEDRGKPATAAVGGVSVSFGVAKVKYTLSGVACPAEISGVASLSGAVTGKASVKVAAGKTTVISIPVKGSKGSAQFKIVLKTNGRPTTQTAEVRVG